MTRSDFDLVVLPAQTEADGARVHKVERARKTGTSCHGARARHAGDIDPAIATSRRWPLIRRGAAESVLPCRTTKQRKTLTLGDIERHIIYGNNIVEAFGDAFEANQRFVRYWPALACVHSRLRIRTKRGDFGATAMSLCITSLGGKITGLSRTVAVISGHEVLFGFA